MSMDQKTLRRAQLVELEILKEVKRVCDKYGIHYWLDSGTLLGAVRHGGFIPWDDDLDIGMLRKDYERFTEIAPKELGEKYVFQNWYLTKGYYFPFGKVRKKGTVWQEMKASKLEENGIYIDIFPYDVYPDGKKEQNKQHYYIDIFKRAIAVKHGDRAWISAGGIDWARLVRYIPAIVVALFIDENSKRKYDKRQCLYNCLDKHSYYFPSGASQYGRWLVKKDILDSLSLIKFEDDMFPCPANPDEYLRSCYGDYMKLPPIEKRQFGHSIVEVVFDEK